MAWLFVKTVYYPAFYTYHGEYGGTIVEFKTPPDQIPFMDKLGEWIADRLPAEAAKEGVTPLKLRVLKDTDPTWWTTWQVEFWGHGSLTLLVLLSLLPLILKGAIAVLVVFFGWQIVKSISGLWQATPEEIELDTKTLDLAEKMLDEGYSPDETITFVENLRGYSESEIDDIITSIKAGVLPEIPTAALVAAGVGGVAVIGLIAVMAMSKRD
ncbi:hypothetical protein ES705_22370 [subsurface metagenome]